jgi:hypothetical protein
VDEGYRTALPRARLTDAMADMGDPTLRPGSWAFVGRDREVAELVAGLEDAIGGRGRLFLIAGEPGIGKTWLAEHLAEHATKRKARLLWGRCWEAGGAPPFWPWSQIIGDLAEGLDEQTLIAWLGAGAAHVARLVPGLGERLGTEAIASVLACVRCGALLPVRGRHWLVQAGGVGAAAVAGLGRSPCG